MAVNLSGSFGKRIASKVFNPACFASFPSSAASRRAVHLSAYDREIDDQVRPTVVPDHVVPSESDGKYWGPYPNTGVFGPATAGEHPAAKPPQGNPAVPRRWTRPLGSAPSRTSRHPTLESHYTAAISPLSKNNN